MRVVIKGADFSSVSIGKVVEDLSFSFKATDGVAAINEFFPTYNSGSPISAPYYVGTNGSEVTLEASGSSSRVVSDYHKVSEGMSVVMSYLSNPFSGPIVICFDENKNILSSKCFWNSDQINKTITIPSGVSYVKFQTNYIADGLTTPRITVDATM
jgi:hypothetical protein